MSQQIGLGEKLSTGRFSNPFAEFTLEVIYFNGELVTGGLQALLAPDTSENVRRDLADLQDLANAEQAARAEVVVLK